MSILFMFLVATLQGLTEFLPVSSSGHVAFISYLFDFQEVVSLNIMVHIGSLGAIVFYFWKDLWELFCSLLKRDKDTINYIFMLFVATLVTTVIYVLGKRVFIEAYSNLAIISTGWLYTAGVVYFIDRFSKKDVAAPEVDVESYKENINKVSLKNALVVGALQGLAIFPGISRSGSTVFGSLLSGLNKDAAFRFSFLLAIPAILGGAIFEFRDLDSVEIETAKLIMNSAAIVISFGVSLFAIALFKKLLVAKSLKLFSVYLIVMAAIGFFLHFSGIDFSR